MTQENVAAPVAAFVAASVAASVAVSVAVSVASADAASIAASTAASITVSIPMSIAASADAASDAEAHPAGSTSHSCFLPPGASSGPVASEAQLPLRRGRVPEAKLRRPPARTLDTDVGRQAEPVRRALAVPFDSQHKAVPVVVASTAYS